MCSPKGKTVGLLGLSAIVLIALQPSKQQHESMQPTYVGPGSKIFLSLNKKSEVQTVNVTLVSQFSLDLQALILSPNLWTLILLPSLQALGHSTNSIKKKKTT